MKINKFKTLQILSDGSICFIYKTNTTLNNFNVSKQDNKNFILNIKKNKIQINFKTFTNYKKTYFKK